MRCSPWLLSLFLVSVASAQVIEQKTPVTAGSGTVTVTGSTPVTGNCAQFSGPTSIADAGAACGSGGGGSGTVTSVSVTTANGVSGVVATPTVTPAITLTLGAITPTTVNGNTVPTAADTVTLLGATQTLTNKSISGSQINSGTIPAAQLPLATTGAFGAVKPDGSTVTISAGVISAVGGAATTITPGTTTIIGGTAPCLIYNSTSTTMGCAAVSSSVLSDFAASTTFTVAGTGCTPSAHAGGPFSGTITLASGPCTSVTVTMNGATGFTAPVGYHCDVNDRTLMAAGTWFGSWGESATSTTTATLPIPGAAGATDVISFSCSYF